MSLVPLLVSFFRYLDSLVSRIQADNCRRLVVILLGKKREYRHGREDLGSGYGKRIWDIGRRHGEGSWGSTGERVGHRGGEWRQRTGERKRVVTCREKERWEWNCRLCKKK